MSTPPNKRLHEDVSGSGSGGVNNNHPSSVLKFPLDNYSSAVGGKVSSRNDYHVPPPYDMDVEGRMPKITQRNESDRRSPLPSNMLFRVSTPTPTPNDSSHMDHVGTENRMEFRESIKVDNNREVKSDYRDLQQQTSKSDKYADENKDSKHAYSEPKGNEKMNGGYNSGSNSHLNWKDMKEQQQRVKQYPDVPSVDTWHALPRSDIASKEISHVDNNNRGIGEAVGENKIDMKGDDKFKDKDRKRKEVKQHWEWGERDKDRRNNNFPPPGNSENKEVVKEEIETERWGNAKKEQKEKLNEKENGYVKRELWSSTEKVELFLNEKEVVGKSAVDQESSALEPKKKDHDTRNNVDRKERDTDHVELARPDKRSRYHEKELDEGGILAEGGGTEHERDVLSSGAQPRKRMPRPRSSPQMANNPRHRAGTYDNEGSLGKSDVSCVAYKSGECMHKLIKLWNEYECKQADKSCEGSQNGPTLEIRISAEHVTATNRQVRGGQLWGTDVYTVDSDLVAVLMHTGYCRPTASPPPATQELRATIKVLPPQDYYISTLRNNVRSRAWGAAIGCSYRVERCSTVKSGGGIIDLEPSLTHSSTMEPTLAPVAVERTMTTRAAASNALRQQRFVREVTIQFNLCMEPWLKYSISAVADKGLKKSLFTSARLKKGEVLYVETHSRRYELCFNGEKVMKSHAHGVGTGRAQTSYNLPHHLSNGEKHALDGDSSAVDVFRWSRCKRHLPQKIMQSIGIPLSLEHVEVLEVNLEWNDISWSQTGAWIGGKEYHLARAHFLTPN